MDYLRFNEIAMEDLATFILNDIKDENMVFNLIASIDTQMQNDMFTERLRNYFHVKLELESNNDSERII